MSFGLGSSNASFPPQPTAPVDASTPWMAASDGNLSLLQSSLTQLQLSPSAADENGYTLLQAAASYSHISVMQWLVQQSINVNAVDQEGDTALHYAATVEAAKFLLEVARIDASIRNTSGKTALESKREELNEMMQDEDNDDEDPDFINLKAVVDFLGNLNSMAQ